MSVIQYIACQHCMDALQIGQNDYIYYSDPDEMKKLQDFLFKHRANHDLVFIDENFITLDKNDKEILVDYWHKLKKGK